MKLDILTVELILTEVNCVNVEKNCKRNQVRFGESNILSENNFK